MRSGLEKTLVKPSKRKAKKTNSATHRSYRHTSNKRNGGVRKRAINTSKSSGGFTPNNTEENTPNSTNPNDAHSEDQNQTKGFMDRIMVTRPPRSPPPPVQ